MAVNKIFAETQGKNREAVVPAATLPGVPLIAEGRPAVTLTAEKTATKTITQSDGTVITFNIGGVGNSAGKATCAFDGTFEFAVVGATTGTLNGVEVFLITASGLLTLTTGTNVHYGWTDYPVGYRKEAARAAVRIGA